ncbi:threonylcarbamoyl-AMP synthase, partial [Candidatus Uhrbacteria bacterium]|nr:threonylcarbamoyl-AMP synthase [Candidatus Uhrbacteria bacterium]
AQLRAGGLLIYPTETSYAIGCDATNANAVRSILRLKGRERGKPLPLIVASRTMAERYARFTPIARRFARRYWPGPLTIVAASSKLQAPSHRLATGIIAPNHTVALRVSSHPIARALSRSLGRPIVSTSANRAGAPSCYSARAALRSLGFRQEHARSLSVLDLGPLPRRRPSTIVDARGDRLIVLRQGSIRV